MGFGVWACLAGRQASRHQPAETPLPFSLSLLTVSLCEKERGGKRGEVKVFVYLTFLILDLEGSTKFQQCKTGG